MKLETFQSDKGIFMLLWRCPNPAARCPQGNDMFIPNVIQAFNRTQPYTDWPNLPCFKQKFGLHDKRTLLMWIFLILDFCVIILFSTENGIFQCFHWYILSGKEPQAYFFDLEILILFILTTLSSYCCFGLNDQLKQNSSVENYLLECTHLRSIYKFIYKEY